ARNGDRRSRRIPSCTSSSRAPRQATRSGSPGRTTRERHGRTRRRSRDDKAVRRRICRMNDHKESAARIASGRETGMKKAFVAALCLGLAAGVGAQSATDEIEKYRQMLADGNPAELWEAKGE